MVNGLFYIVRHGTTPNNGKDEYRGWDTGPNSQLNAAGRKVIREAGIVLKNAGLKFPLILSDSLPRALESAKILAEILEIPEQEIDDRLRTINVGDLTGKSKSDHPLDEYLKDKNKKIPGGESFNHFNHRMAQVFGDVLETVDKIGPILLVLHGANISYLYNHFNHPEVPISYEGLVNPGGVLMFTPDGIVPLTQLRGTGKSPYKDGTALAGYVTEEENRPPRSCWNCRWVNEDVNGLYSCTHPVVRIDPETQSHKNADGTIAVSENSCCDGFQNKIGT